MLCGTSAGPAQASSASSWSTTNSPCPMAALWALSWPSRIGLLYGSQTSSARGRTKSIAEVIDCGRNSSSYRELASEGKPKCRLSHRAWLMGTLESLPNAVTPQPQPDSESVQPSVSRAALWLSSPGRSESESPRWLPGCRRGRALVLSAALRPAAAATVPRPPA